MFQKVSTHYSFIPFPFAVYMSLNTKNLKQKMMNE